MYDVRQWLDTLEENRRRDAGKSVNRIILIPQIDLLRHELWEFRTYYFNYRGAFYSVHFHTAIFILNFLNKCACTIEYLYCLLNISTIVTTLQ